MLPTQFQDQVARRYVGDGRHRFQRISLQVRNLLKAAGATGDVDEGFQGVKFSPTMGAYVPPRRSLVLV